MLDRRVVFLPSLILFLFALVATAVAQQDKPPSKVDVFVGYSWLNPRGNVCSSATSACGPQLPSLPIGGTGNITYFFNPWAGITIDGGGNVDDTTSVYTAQIGPTFRFHNSSGVVPFIHTLVGLHQ